MIPFVIAMIGECLGYAFRRVSADHLRGRGAALTWYLLQECVALTSFNWLALLETKTGLMQVRVGCTGCS